MITFDIDGNIYHSKLGHIGIWWKWYDKKVSLRYGITPNSFNANNEQEIINKLSNLK